MEWMLTCREAGKSFLLQGNEAICRGALEAGVRFAASYPGSPSAEILTMLGKVAKEMDLYAEWSTNETCALEAAMGTSFAGVRALCVMKQNGLLVAGDALHTAALSGCKGGVVLVTADDPSAHSSTNEFDSRHQARSAGLPLLEPATFQEAKDMVKYGFELSEELGQMVMVRGVTRICHGRGNVVLGELPDSKKGPATIGEWDRLVGINWLHQDQHRRLMKAQTLFESSPFNWYQGPDDPELVIVTCGTGWFYSHEAVNALGLASRAGILKLGTTWPLPENFVLSCLKRCRQVLVVEEVDPFLEQNLAFLLARNPELGISIYGRAGQNSVLPAIGELNPDLVIETLASLMKAEIERPKVAQVSLEEQVVLPPRELTFCAGCPHRASFFALKQALRLNGMNGVVMGDIGCYTMGAQRAGFYGMHALGCMGGGVNMGEGLSQLNRFGFKQPVVALAGDSTFFHACLPGLINAKFHNSDMLFIILDNAATAMTGFQPHPAIGITAMGEEVEPVSIDEVVKAIGCPVTVADPYEVDKTTKVIYDLLRQPGLKVLILRQACATLKARRGERRKVYVDPDLCRGDECGCGRFCSRVWGCPGNIWDCGAGKARIDEVVCIGCGVCAEICPANAIRIVRG